MNSLSRFLSGPKPNFGFQRLSWLPSKLRGDTQEINLQPPQPQGEPRIKHRVTTVWFTGWFLLCLPRSTLSVLSVERPYHSEHDKDWQSWQSVAGQIPGIISQSIHVSSRFFSSFQPYLHSLLSPSRSGEDRHAQVILAQIFHEVIGTGRSTGPADPPARLQTQDRH